MLCDVMSSAAPPFVTAPKKSSFTTWMSAFSASFIMRLIFFTSSIKKGSKKEILSLSLFYLQEMDWAGQNAIELPLQGNNSIVSHAYSFRTILLRHAGYQNKSTISQCLETKT